MYYVIYYKVTKKPITRFFGSEMVLYKTEAAAQSYINYMPRPTEFEVMAYDGPVPKDPVIYG